MTVNCKKLIEITQINDIHRLDRELDHLFSLSLIRGGFDSNSKELVANITPTPLALNLYLKTQGYNDDPIKFWKTGILTHVEWKNEFETIEKPKKVITFKQIQEQLDKEKKSVQ